jgi:hypothetical protein
VGHVRNMSEDGRILLNLVKLSFITVGCEDVWIQLLMIATRSNLSECINK